MRRFLGLVLLAFGLFLFGFGTPGIGQDKSVKPGINDPFKNPEVKDFVAKFEIESREVFDKRAKILAACKVKAGSSVADIGAGTGLFTRLFSEAVGKDGTVFAVDISPKFLEHITASNKTLGITNVQTVLGKDASPELKEKSVDLVFICDTYHHFEFPQRMMTAIHKALKPGGKLIVIDFVRIEGKSSDWTLKHVRAGQPIVEKEIAECGFKKIDEVKDLMKDNYFLLFEKK